MIPKNALHDINAPSTAWNSWRRQKGRPGRPLLYSNHNLNHTQRHFYATTHVYCKSCGLRHRKCKIMIREGKTSTDRFIWLSEYKNVISSCSYLHFYWKTLWGILYYKDGVFLQVCFDDDFGCESQRRNTNIDLIFA